MRILFLGNNRVGWQVAEWLKKEGEDIVGLVLHPRAKQKFAEEITAAVNLSAGAVIDGSQLRKQQVIEAIRALQPDIGVSALFGYILQPAILEMMPAGCVNIHPSLLPYNRGAYPNVWSIIDGTPAGATIHYIDVGIDTGDIIAQRAVPVELTDTGASLYAKLEVACVDLFKETWPSIRSGHALRTPQVIEGGTAHKVQDIVGIDEINMDEIYRARDIINIIRARTFPPYRGAYIQEAGRKVYLRLELFAEEDDS